MKWACRASPGRAVMTSGRGSSGAGLTVAATRDGAAWALEAGALVGLARCTGGVVPVMLKPFPSQKSRG
jgi:DNA replicative helicase MCM subunit Mcm2 (Cdc46/Mcm family)